MSLLRDKTPFVIDFETFYIAQKLSVRSMTLRQYMQQSHVTMFSYKLGDADAVVLTAEQMEHSRHLFELLADHDDVVFVAHNSSFDFRVWHFMCGLPYPKHGLCTMELSQAAWPNQPGGNSLENLCKTRPRLPKKIEIDLTAGKHTEAELHEYVKRDVDCCAGIYEQAVAVLPDNELRLAALTSRSREIVLRINHDKLDDCVDAFDTLATEAAEAAIKALGIDGDDGFGWDDPVTQTGLRSVKPQAMKEILSRNLGFNTTTISQKKINPEHLRRNTGATTVIQNTSAANKALWHKRNTAKFAAVDEMDLELCYYAAHTGRWSGRGTGKGLNVQNMPKRDKTVAKPFRSMIILPDEYCWVRADAANLEYRIECLMTGCAHGVKLFEADVNADPYTAFGYAAIGQLCNKSDPIRQVWKAAVLGLGYGMSPHRWMSELQLMLASPQVYGVTLKDLEDICADNGWGKPKNDYIKKAMRLLNAPWQVAAVAEHTHKLFHDVHPEFMRTARWIEDTVTEMVGSSNPAKALAIQRRKQSAPPEEFLDFSMDRTIQGRSLRVRCGLWTDTLCWRDLSIRPYKYNGQRQIGMTAMQGGNKGFRSMTKQIEMENICQSMGRNAIAAASLKLEDLGHQYQANVHDEILLRTPRNAADIFKAQYDMLNVMGAGNGLGYGWAMHIKPEEICVTQSFHEDESVMPQLWQDLMTGEKCLEELV